MALLFQVTAVRAQSGPIGLWHLDGNASDSSGTGHDGTIVGATPISDGIAGGAFHFDGNASIDVGNLDFSGGQYTVSLWIRITSPAVTNDYRMAIAKGDSGTGDMTFEIIAGDGQANGGGGGNAPMYNVWAAPAVTVVTTWPEGEASGINVRDGNWHMVTATYTSGSQSFYVDGSLVASRSYAGPLPLVSEDVMIGGFEGFGPYHHRWIGDIDEVSIYDRVLDAAEVEQLYAGSVTVARMPFSPNPVVGGVGAQGTLFLNSGAPQGGLTISLASSNPSIVTLPSSVAVPAGEDSVAFTVNTSPVAVDTSVTITADLDGVNTSASLLVTVFGAALRAVTVYPPSGITGGYSPTVGVYLTGPAAADLVVPLSSSDTNIASVPSGVIVPAGKSGVTFRITTYPQRSDSTVTVTAYPGGANKSAPLLVKAPVVRLVLLWRSSVTGGAKTGGYVYLTGTTAADFVVPLSSSDPSVATVPSSVTVRAGKYAAGFTVTTYPQPAVTGAIITADPGGANKSASLTVTR
jgi:hypothetical protein